jgi:O-antigen/teichoic acid export membrane protein
MTARNEIARDVVASVSRHVATAVVGFITIPIISRSLGAKMLGFWSLLGTAAFLVGLCDLGLSAATLRAAAGTDPALAKRASHHAARRTLLVALPVTALCAMWLLRVAEELPFEQRGTAKIAVLVALAAGVVNAVAQPARAYVHGRGHIVALARARTVGTCVQLAVTVAALVAHWRLLAVAAGYAAGVLVETWISCAAARDGVDARGALSAEERVSLGSVSRSALVINVSVAVAVRIDVFVLQQVTTLETIAAYSVAARLIDQGYTLVKQISAALVPRLGARAADPERVLSMATMIMGALAAAPLAVVAVAGAPLIVLWAGPAVDCPTLAMASGWLAVAAIVAATEEIAASRMSLGGDPRIAARAIFFGSLANVVLSVIGSRTMGASAVAASTLLGNLVTTILVWKATAAAFKWSFARVAGVLFPTVAAGAVGALAATLFTNLAVHTLIVVSLATILGGAAAYGSMRRTLRGAVATLA